DDASLRWIAGEANVVPYQAREEASVAKFRQHDPRPDDGQRLPFPAGDVRRAGRRDNADARTRGPTRVDCLDERRLKVGVAKAVDEIAIRIVAGDRVFADKWQIAAYGQC